MIENELVQFLDKETIRIQCRLDAETPSQLADALVETITALFIRCFGKDEMDDSLTPEAEIVKAFGRLDNARFDTRMTIQEHLKNLVDFIDSERI